MKQRVYSFTNARFVIYINLYYIEKSYYSYFKVTVSLKEAKHIYSRTHGRIKIKFEYKVKVNLKVTE